MAIIKIPNNVKVITEKEEKLINYFALQEINDFKSYIDDCKFQFGQSSMFNEVSYLLDEMKEKALKIIYEKNYSKNKEHLRPPALSKLYDFYNERLDLKKLSETENYDEL
jgi:hypothetical protein